MTKLKKPLSYNQIYSEIRKTLNSKYKNISPKKVLWIEWWSSGREINQMKYVIIFLKDILNWEIDFVSQFNPIECLGKSYDLAITSGVVGHKLGSKWASYINLESKIDLFISETEGIYLSEYLAFRLSILVNTSFRSSAYGPEPEEENVTDTSIFFSDTSFS